MAKGKGGKDKKKKEPKKPKMIGNETLGQIVRRLLKTYEKKCSELQSSTSSKLTSQMKMCIENEALLENFILTWNNVAPASDRPVTLEPLVLSLRHERYSYLTGLRVWNLPIDHVSAASLALLIEKGFIPFKELEIMDCLLGESALVRLAMAFPVCTTLTHLCFDYNEFGDEGCKGLCRSLEESKTLLSLSLNYCSLGVPSGKVLGHILATTTVREIFLDGNDLGCEGALDLIGQCSVAAEIEWTEKLKTAESNMNMDSPKLDKDMLYNNTVSAVNDNAAEPNKSAANEKPEKNKKKKGKKKKGKAPPPPPVAGPWIHKLHLADNAIDGLKAQSVLTNPAAILKSTVLSEPELSAEPEVEVDVLTLFLQEISRLITYSDCLEEVDMEDDFIGDLGGHRILGALIKREEMGLPGMKVRTTPQMQPDTFNEIVKLAAGLKKKKKKKKGKKK